jgi:formylglycine-generating enzyme required for sulfatase activity
LAKEAERAKELEAERLKIEADLAAQAKERERQRSETEAKLAALKANVPVAVNSDMTIEQARARVTELQKKIEDVRRSTETAKAAALRKLTDDYAPLRARLPQAVAKDELETTAEYQARLATAEKQRQALEDRFSVDQAQIEKQFAAELDTTAQPWSSEIERLKQTKYADTIPVVWDHYDADSGRLSVTSGQRRLVFTVPLEKARELAGRKESLALRSDLALNPRSEGLLVDRMTGDRFESAIRRKANPKDGLTYVRVDPGRYMEGCSPGDSECRDDEKPARQVTIARGFWMGETPVTQAAYLRVTGAGPSHFKGDQLPVESITWDEAKNYCQAVGMRLPTEAEWEYAARGGTAGARYGRPDDIAWYTANSGGKTHAVGQKTPNAYGLYDMLGNVWEWVSVSREEEAYRSLRGGSWVDLSRAVRASFRYRVVPGNRDYNIGVRCVGD